MGGRGGKGKGKAQISRTKGKGKGAFFSLFARELTWHTDAARTHARTARNQTISRSGHHPPNLRPTSINCALCVPHAVAAADTIAGAATKPQMAALGLGQQIALQKGPAPWLSGGTAPTEKGAGGPTWPSGTNVPQKGPMGPHGALWTQGSFGFVSLGLVYDFWDSFF